MPKFRFHRGSLEESLETEVEVKDKSELYKVISDYLEYDFSESSLVIQHYGFDNRINKELYSVRIYGFGIVGYLDNNLI